MERRGRTALSGLCGSGGTREGGEYQSLGNCRLACRAAAAGAAGSAQRVAFGTVLAWGPGCCACVWVNSVWALACGVPPLQDTVASLGGSQGHRRYVSTTGAGAQGPGQGRESRRGWSGACTEARPCPLARGPAGRLPHGLRPSWATRHSGWLPVARVTTTHPCARARVSRSHCHIQSPCLQWIGGPGVAVAHLHHGQTMARRADRAWRSFLVARCSRTGTPV